MNSGSVVSRSAKAPVAHDAFFLTIISWMLMNIEHMNSCQDSAQKMMIMLANLIESMRHFLACIQSRNQRLPANFNVAYLIRFINIFNGIFEDYCRNLREAKAVSSIIRALANEAQTISVAAVSSLTTMTPADYARMQAQIRWMTKLFFMIDELCFGGLILDQIDLGFNDFPSVESRNIFEMLSANGGVTTDQFMTKNYSLRYFLMCIIYQDLHGLIFGLKQCFGLLDPEYKAALKRLINIFVPYLPSNKLMAKPAVQGALSAIINEASKLQNKLNYEDAGRYVICVPDFVPFKTRIADLGNKVEVVHIIGADHTDDSNDVVQEVVFGGLKRMPVNSRNGEDHGVFVMKPKVIAHRPKVDE